MAERRYHLGGEVDLATAPKLRADLALAISQDGAHLLIDCTDLTFIDSTGIAVLLEALRDLEVAGRHMRVVNAGSAPRHTFEIHGLTDLLQYDPEPAT